MDLITIIKMLFEMRQDVVLALAGKGTRTEHLKEKVKEWGLEQHVQFLGFVSEEDKQVLLNATDIFVIASEAELQSIATLEAMAQGCAVLAADFKSSAVVELVTGAGCGVGYDPTALECAAQQIHHWLCNPEVLKHLQSKALESAQQYDLLSVGRRLISVYEAVLHDHKTKM
jgi:1,2-diacylglycerol 3-alpha-glucosyltransferase